MPSRASFTGFQRRFLLYWPGSRSAPRSKATRCCGWGSPPPVASLSEPLSIGLVGLIAAGHSGIPAMRGGSRRRWTRRAPTFLSPGHALHDARRAEAVGTHRREELPSARHQAQLRAGPDRCRAGRRRDESTRPPSLLRPDWPAPRAVAPFVATVHDVSSAPASRGAGTPTSAWSGPGQRGAHVPSSRYRDSPATRLRGIFGVPMDRIEVIHSGPGLTDARRPSRDGLLHPSGRTSSTCRRPGRTQERAVPDPGLRPGRPGSRPAPRWTRRRRLRRDPHPEVEQARHKDRVRLVQDASDRTSTRSTARRSRS